MTINTKKPIKPYFLDRKCSQKKNPTATAIYPINFHL